MIVDELRVVGSTQTNVVMAAELVRVARRALGERPPEPRKEGLGQLIYPFDPGLAWAAVTYLRTPTRVLWDVYRCRAQRLEPLYAELMADIARDTRTLWRDRDGISVEARRVEAFAAGERQIVGTVKNALVDGAGRRGKRLHVDPDRPATRWVARLDERDELVVSIDLGGGSLSQRGWRREAGDAPLREHLAAVLLMLARWDPRVDALVDPMCGAGTIPIEAVHAARATPREAPTLAALGIESPGLAGTRSDAQRRGGAIESHGLAGTRSDAQRRGGTIDRDAQPLFADANPLVIGCDIDLEVLAAARDNARAARVTEQITWQRCDVARLTPELVRDIASERGRAAERGLLIANPPYGERLDEHDLEDVYGALAGACARFRGWRAAFLVGSPILEEVFFRVVGRPRIKKPLANANLRAYFYLYEL